MKYEEALPIAAKWEQEQQAGHGALVARALYRQMVAQPVAWIATVQVAGGPEVASEFDVVCIVSDEAPDKHNKWSPLYAHASPQPVAIPEGWEAAIEEISKRLDSDEPSIFDRSGYREYAGVVLDAVVDKLHELAASPPPPDSSADAAKPVEFCRRPHCQTTGGCSKACSKPLSQSAAIRSAGLSDERAAFEAWARIECNMPAHIPFNWDGEWIKQTFYGWQARAALAPTAAEVRREALDVNRYQFLRSLFLLSEEELSAVQAAMDIFDKDDYHNPTPEEFDASVDAGIRALPTATK